MHIWPKILSVMNNSNNVVVKSYIFLAVSGCLKLMGVPLCLPMLTCFTFFFRGCSLFPASFLYSSSFNLINGFWPFVEVDWATWISAKEYCDLVCDSSTDTIRAFAIRGGNQKADVYSSYQYLTPLHQHNQHH